MDLKSMLNDSSAQRQQPPPQPPRLHTPHSSDHHPYDPISRTLSNSTSRPSSREPSAPYPPQHPSSGHRTNTNGSYFSPQSPPAHNPASASTSAIAPSPGPSSIYAQSPGPHGHARSRRDSIPPQQQHPHSFVPSPSPSGPYPSTPGSLQHQTPSSASNYHHPPPYPPYSQSPRDEIAIANGHAHSSSRNISPNAQFHPPPPATPLGPPAAYPRPPPHSIRPPSQGHENFRRSSAGSVGSAHSRDFNSAAPPQLTHSRSGSAQRSYSGDVRDLRERSIESVSPKTIPRPPPHRQPSDGRVHEINSAPPQPVVPPSPLAAAGPGSLGTPDRVLGLQANETTPKSSSASLEPRTAPSTHQSSRASPAAFPPSNMTPQSTHSPLPQLINSPAVSHNGLKRNASHLSSVPSTPQPPRKRPRQDDIPVWAQSARARQLKFIKSHVAAPIIKRETPLKQEMPNQIAVNGQGQTQAQPQIQPQMQPQQAPPTPLPNDGIGMEQPHWEPSIINITPHEDLTKRVCDWIAHFLVNAATPTNGATFEIEAKVGAIWDEDTGTRMSLPVDTEAVFSRERYRGKTSFRSSMNMAQHKQVNAFLNSIVEESHKEASNSNRVPIFYSHPHEYDEFYELTEDGRRNLPPSIRNWLNPRHKPKVRRTINENNDEVKAQIIKSRIADLDVYNPQADFDYRISISIESPWEGVPEWLTEMSETSRDRKKDRMSYRHMAYQIDLTQVSFPNSGEKEHELEVEISTEMVRRELDNLKAERPSMYEQLIRGLIDNVRVLCRRSTMPSRGR